MWTVIVKHGGTLREVARVHVTRIQKESAEEKNEEKKRTRTEEEGAQNKKMRGYSARIIQENEESNREDTEEESLDESSKESATEGSPEESETEELPWQHKERVRTEREAAENQINIYKLKKGERYQAKNEENEMIKMEIKSRAGKVSSKEWGASYNVRDITSGHEKWIDFKQLREIE